jgi:ubiquinone biosynthesis protein
VSVRPASVSSTRNASSSRRRRDPANGADPTIVRRWSRTSWLATVFEDSGLAASWITFTNSATLADLARSFVADLERELDYAGEARAAAKLAIAFEGTELGVPTVRHDLSGATVLVMDRVQGVTLAAADLSGLTADIRRQKATALVGAHIGAMLAGGRFHADPHPGNVMLTDRGDIYLIDFGATGVLSPTEQSALASLFLGIRLREPTMLRDSLIAVSQSDGPVDTARLDRSLSHLLSEHLRPDENMGPEAVVELLRIMRDEQLRLPASSSPMFPSLVTILDSLERLAPGFAVLDGIEQLDDVQSPVPSTPQEFAQLPATRRSSCSRSCSGHPG